jgi:tetratricopeptide (TPR) repeat protein
MKYSFLGLLLIALITSCSNSSKESSGTELTANNIDSLLTLYPDSIPLLLFRGNDALKEYRFYDALADGAKAFRLDSMNADVRMLYAQSLNNKANRTIEEVATAQRHFHYVVFHQPKNTDALVALASTYRHFQDVDKAFKYVNDALKIDPKKREAYALKGSLYIDLENYKLAKSSYETAVQQDPEFYEAYLHLGMLYEKEKNPICLEYYETAHKLNPKDPELLYLLAFSTQYFGEVQKDASKIDMSKTMYRQLAENEDNYYKSRGLFHLGHLKQRLENQIDSAIFFYSNAIIVQKDYVEAYHNRGMCYELKGDYQSARQEFLKALKYDEEFTLSIDAYNRIEKK